MENAATNGVQWKYVMVLRMVFILGAIVFCILTIATWEYPFRGFRHMGIVRVSFVLGGVAYTFFALMARRMLEGTPVPQIESMSDGVDVGGSTMWVDDIGRIRGPYANEIPMIGDKPERR